MKLEHIIREVFSLKEDIKINDKNGPGSLPGWDSIGHVDLINSVEENYEINISNDEIMQIKSIADIKKILIENGLTEF